MDIIAHRRVGEAHVFVVQGDVTVQPVDAVLNAANEALAHGGGVAAAIVGAGGRVIQEESDQWVRSTVQSGRGQAAVTTAGALQASHVIHVVGPRYQSGTGTTKACSGTPLSPPWRQRLRSRLDPWHSRRFLQASSGTSLAGATKVLATAVVDWLASHPGTIEEVLVGFDAATAGDFASGLHRDRENPKRLMDAGLGIDKNQSDRNKGDTRWSLPTYSCKPMSAGRPRLPTTSPSYPV